MPTVDEQMWLCDNTHFHSMTLVTKYESRRFMMNLESAVWTVTRFGFQLDTGRLIGFTYEGVLSRLRFEVGD